MSFTSSVSPELLQGFARGIARVAFLRNITLLAINMKAIGEQVSLKTPRREQVDYSLVFITRHTGIGDTANFQGS